MDIFADRQEPVSMFERDPDQHRVPPGFIAYLLRRWDFVETGTVTKVRVVGGRPHLTFDRIECSRRPRYPGEISRVFVLTFAEIDPAVFGILADPAPISLDSSGPHMHAYGR
ncbi:MAG: hypothetical protein M3N19_03610 [Candidatus Eremiobacteraeota bacterium]|nr:hypothetical protein [Candidatus Eremiobacteraeota bacterium]